MIKLILSLIFIIGIGNFKGNKVRKSLVCFFFSIYLLFFWVRYSRNLWVGNYYFFCDFYSYILVILRLWIRGCILIINLSKFKEIIIIILLISLIICFFSINIILFYFIFEVGLLPIFFLILYGGYSFDRFEAIIYILIFTVLSSIPFLWLILYIYLNYYRLKIIILIFIIIKLDWVLFLICLLGFIVKLPIFIFHIWLPKAHVEAPVYGSIILAGVLLKLGRYGILRIIQIFSINMIDWRFAIIRLGIIGRILIRLVCLIQVDIKMLVAYSSVVHIRLLIRGIVSISKIGLIGGLIIIIAHGLCSSGLFYLVNINYERFRRRLIYLNKGSLSIYPTLRLFWFLFCSSNLSAPVRLNLVGEIFLLIRIVRWNFILVLFLILFCFFRAAYSIYLFRIRQHGNNSILLINFKNITIFDYLILILHWLPLNILFLSLDLFI